MPPEDWLERGINEVGAGPHRGRRSMFSVDVGLIRVCIAALAPISDDPISARGVSPPVLAESRVTDRWHIRPAGRALARCLGSHQVDEPASPGVLAFAASRTYPMEHRRPADSLPQA
jgi:hypothetical protein